MNLINSAVYVIVAGFICFLIGEALPRKWFNENKFPYLNFRWEDYGHIYDTLKIKKWKTKLLDMSKIVKRMVPKKVPRNITVKQLDVLIKETCVAEFIHIVLCFVSVGIYWIWKNRTGIIVWFLCIAGNLPYIFVQRYNRPHLKKIRDKLIAKQSDNTKSELFQT